MECDGQDVGVEPLETFFARTPRFAVAFSGGCDSAYLLSAACDAGCEVKAYLVKTAFQPEYELEDARIVVKRMGASFEVVPLDVFDGSARMSAVCANPPDRCYLCKTAIFSTIWEHARRDGFDVLVDGTNATDDPARRPGFRALAQLGVVSPLRRAGLTKDDVRADSAALERKLGLSQNELMSEKPSFPCLAVFVKQGQAITPESLARAAKQRGLA